MRQGIHKKRYPNHATYRGYYVDDRRHGIGVKTWADGTKVLCRFRHGKKIDLISDHN